MFSVGARLLLSCALGACIVLSFLVAWSRLSNDTDDAGGPNMHPAARLTATLNAPCEPSPTCLGNAADHSAIAAQLYRQLPASPTPFAYAALRKLSDGVSVAAPAAQAAVNRNPRVVVAQAILAEEALARGDIAERLFRLERLLQLGVGDRSAITQNIAALDAIPEGADLLRQRINAKAPWAQDVINTLIANGVDPARVLPLAANFRVSQSRLIDRILAASGPRVAFLAWASVVDPQAVSTLRWPFDPEFKGSPAPPPFNWALSEGAAELQPGGGLNAFYSGKGRIVIARQLMILQPGAYSFTTMAHGETGAKGGELRWRAICDGAAEPLFELRLDALRGKSTPFNAAFRVPNTACSAVDLALLGIPGEFPLRARAIIDSVAIDQTVASFDTPSTPHRAAQQRAPTP